MNPDQTSEQYAEGVAAMTAPSGAEVTADEARVDADAAPLAADQLLREQDAVAAPAHVAVDPLELAGQVLVDAFTALRSKPPAAQKLDDKIALGQALATLARAQATRMQTSVNETMAQVALEDRHNMLQRAAGPSGIVVPNVQLRSNGRS